MIGFALSESLKQRFCTSESQASPKLPPVAPNKTNQTTSRVLRPPPPPKKKRKQNKTKKNETTKTKTNKTMVVLPPKPRFAGREGLEDQGWGGGRRGQATLRDGRLGWDPGGSDKAPKGKAVKRPDHGV